MIQAEVFPKTGFVSVKQIRKHARPKIRAAVMLGNVTLSDKAVGNLTGEFEEAMSWEDIELPETIKSRFRTARFSSLGFFDTKTKQPLTQAQAMVVLGDSCYYLP